VREPIRWKDDPEARPAAADILLRGTRRPQGPQPHEVARLGMAVDALARRPGFAKRRHPWFATALAAAITLAALGTGAWAWRATVRRAAPLPLVEQAAFAVAKPRPRVEPPHEVGDEDQPAIAAEAPAPRERRSSTRAHRRERPAQRAQIAPPTPAPSPNVDTLTRETSLVDAARRALAGAPSAALASLDAHRREFPRGQLAAEREFLAVEALRRLGRLPEARRRATELKADHPTSSYADRAARLLEGP
jgi:hypothetical protein